jgi:hypothetical protein
MSLDVYLEMPISHEAEPKIFIRRNGANVEITRAEWDALYPEREPLVTNHGESNEVFWANITHNLGGMADAAGIYHALWRPDEVGFSKTQHLIGPLQEGLKRLKENPGEFRKYNPTNGWGTYEDLIDFAERYLAACEEFPDADVHVSR